jgi:hypothetical protein
VGVPEDTARRQRETGGWPCTCAQREIPRVTAILRREVRIGFCLGGAAYCAASEGQHVWLWRPPQIPWSTKAHSEMSEDEKRRVYVSETHRSARS